MIAVLQRVSSASVEVLAETVGRIGAGCLVLLGVERGDGEHEASALAARVATAGREIGEHTMEIEWIVCPSTGFSKSILPSTTPIVFHIMDDGFAVGESVFLNPDS